METGEKKFSITKCICFDTTFKEMKKIMKENNLKTLEELREVKMVAVNCRLCVPYILKMINTGKTKFETIIEEHL
ncbi:MAG: (2Fe-2S)-binding protein [Ignavibacteria bacterium]